MVLLVATVFHQMMAVHLITQRETESPGCTRVSSGPVEVASTVSPESCNSSVNFVLEMRKRHPNAKFRAGHK